MRIQSFTLSNLFRHFHNRVGVLFGWLGNDRRRREWRAKVKAECGTEAEVEFALRYGILPSSAQYYDFEKYDPALYYGDYDRDWSYLINGDYAMVLRNKYLCYQLLTDQVRIPRVWACWYNGKMVVNALGRRAEGGGGEANSLFFKPLVSWGGIGAASIDYRNGMIVDVDGNEIEVAGYLRQSAEKYPSFLVLERVKQSPFMNSLFSGAVNTMRMLTCRDPEIGEVFMARAILRVGTNKSAPVDNFSSGGISFHIDMETGVIGKGYSKAFDGKLSVHPYTGVEISGMRIPGFESIVSEVVDLHHNMPYIDYAGWDICLTDDGICVIEVNNTTDVDLIQMHGPLLADKRMVRFYEHHKALNLHLFGKKQDSVVV